MALPLPRTPKGPGTKGAVVGHALAGGKLYPPQIKGHCLGEEHHKGEEEWPLVLLTPIRCSKVFRLQGNCPGGQAASQNSKRGNSGEINDNKLQALRELILVVLRPVVIL